MTFIDGKGTLDFVESGLIPYKNPITGRSSLEREGPVVRGTPAPAESCRTYPERRTRNETKDPVGIRSDR